VGRTGQIKSAIGMLTGLVSLAACTTQAPESGQSMIPPRPELVPQKTAIAAPIENKREDIAATPPAPEPDRLVYYEDRHGSINSLSLGSRNYQTDSLQLNFVNAPADQVARAVIAEALGETVAIGEGVTGTITLTSPDPVETSAALEALETVLAASGLALLERPSGFLLTLLSTAQGSSVNIQGRGSAIGYGAVFLRPENTSPATLASLIQPFLSGNVQVEPNETAGVLVLRGPQADINQALEAVRLFDTPALTDRVAGLFELRFADVSTVAEEIRTLSAAENAGNAQAIEIIELPRINQLFVLTRTRAQFGEVRAWIDRLDIASGGDERRLRYYLVLNTPAEILAQQLSAAFLGRAGAGSLSTSDAAIGVQTGNSTTSPYGTAQSLSQNAQSSDSGAPTGLSIVPDQLNNALIIRATDAEYRELTDLIERMDVLPPQVLIEATIAEVTLTDDLNFGVRWFLESGDFEFTLSDNESGGTGPVFPGFSATYFDGNSAGLALNALASVTDVTVLSAPSIMVQNNQAANLQVGDEVPIVTQQAQSVADADAPIISTVQLRETGVILEVKPRINASDMIVLEISQEVSEVTNTVTSGIDSPTIQQRKFNSTVAVANNSTVALGGLIRESRTSNNSGVPGLKNAPIIGNLFKSTDNTTRRTELIVFLTPRIIRNQTDSDRALIYLRGKLGGLYQRLEAQE